MKINRLLCILMSSYMCAGGVLAKDSTLVGKLSNGKVDDVSLGASENYETLANSLKDYFFTELTQGLLNMTYFPQPNQNFFVIPVAGGKWVSYSQSAKSPSSVDFPLLTVVQFAFRDLGTYMINCANWMTPEQRKTNWESPEMKLLRYLSHGERNFPNGTQNNYDFWNPENLEKFLLYTKSGEKLASSLAKDYVAFYSKNPIGNKSNLHELFKSLCK